MAKRSVARRRESAPTPLARMIPTRFASAVILETVPDVGPRFAVGDIATIYSPDHAWHGTQMEIISPFELMIVTNDAGDYVDESGKRVEVRWGYKGKRLDAEGDDGGPYFMPAGMLHDSRNRMRHIRLVPRRRRSKRAKGGAA